MTIQNFLAGFLNKYRFSTSDLDEFLAQPTPRVLPQALAEQSQSTTGDQIGLAIGLGAAIIAPAVVGPLLLWDKLGIWSLVIALADLILAAFVITVVVRGFKRRPSLLKDGVLATGRIEEVARETGYEGEPRWAVALHFEVDGKPIHVTRIVPDDHGHLAQLIQQYNRDVRVLYLPTTPKQAMWAAELLYPCPKVPASLD